MDTHAAVEVLQNVREALDEAQLARCWLARVYVLCVRSMYGVWQGVACVNAAVRQGAHGAWLCGCVAYLFLLSVSGQTTVGQNCLKVHIGIGQQCLRRYSIHPVAFADVEETERVEGH